MNRQTNRLFRRILLNAANDSKSAEKSPEKSPWAQTAEKESNALEAKHDRIPWEDGLPPEIEESLRPFKEQLNSSYDPMMNPLEFMEFRNHGRDGRHVIKIQAQPNNPDQRIRFV